MKNKIKKITGRLLMAFGDILNWVPFSKMKAEDAKEILKDKGYPFANLWNEIRPLQKPQIDLSLIIPVYNNEKYIDKCLSSVLGQKTQYIYEVICIDDGSKDRSLEMLSQWQQKFPEQLKVYSQENQGISKTRNRGLTLSIGRYVGFIDNDDTVSEDYVETLLNTAYKQNVDIVQTAYEKVRPNGEIIGVVSHGDHIIDTSSDEEVLKYTQGWIWGGILKRDIFNNVLFPEGFWYEDMITRLLVIRLAKRIATIGKPMYFYLIHDTNASKTVWKSTNIKVVDELWLAIQLSEYSRSSLKMPVDEILYQVLVEEFTVMLWGRTKGMPLKIRKAIFSMASNYLQSLGYTSRITDRLYMKIDKSLLDGNFTLWNVLCRSKCLIG